MSNHNQENTALLTPESLAAELTLLNNELQEAWDIIDNKLTKTFSFSNFTQAFSFMTEIAQVAESMDHHPDWFNHYNMVNIQLHSYDKNGITERDFRLAHAIEDILLT